MNFQFKETNNQEIFHNNEDINFISDLALNSNDEVLLDIIIEALNFGDCNKKEYFFIIKTYMSKKGIIFGNDFEEHVNNFLKLNKGNVKGAFLEILSYHLLKKYCSYDSLLKECIIIYNSVEFAHPYDLIMLKNDDINLIDIKFSVKHLKKQHLDFLTEFKEDFVNAYLFSLDDSVKIKFKIKYIQRKYNSLNYFNQINLISKNDFYNAILEEECILN